jgi:ubiquinone/menaquinone biosynthesis C-methylase UbiE
VTTPWGQRAAQLYGPEYARRYRTADEEIRDTPLFARFSRWLRQICDSFDRPIVALDLGCGTGRYFRALHNIRELVGIDVSEAMLHEARRPLDGDGVAVERITLIHGDFASHAFPAERFDLVYSIGVLGEHTPIHVELAQRVHRWLAPGGVFAFTAVHRSSFSVPRTVQRRLGEWLLHVSVGPLRRALRARLIAGGLYVDEEYLRATLQAAAFHVQSIERFRSDVHEHCLTVARKVQTS